MRVDRRADIVYCCGAPGTGKSHRLKELLARDRPDRLIVIDADGEFDGWGYWHHHLADLAKVLAYPTYRARFRPSADRSIAIEQFDRICRLVRWQADTWWQGAPPARRGPLTLVVDELADYVGASFREAPPSWQWVVRRGRKYGVSVRAASQRPSEIDKTIFNLASSIRVARLNDRPDQLRLANVVGVPVAEVAALTGYQFIELDKRTGALVRGPAGRRARAVK